MNIILEKLEKLGLNNEESSVYIYLLKNGENTPLKVSKDLNINRTKVYRILDKLAEFELIIKPGTTWGKKFRANSPENLENIIKKIETELNVRRQIYPEIITLLQELKTVETKSTNPEPEAKMSIDEVERIILASPSEIFIFSSNYWKDELGEVYSKINSRIKILSNTFKSKIQNKVESKVLEENILKIRQNVIVFSEYIIIIDGSSAQKVLNKQFAYMMQQMFMYFWKRSK